jgi:sugar phosphate isomerase/epimerase
MYVCAFTDEVLPDFQGAVRACVENGVTDVQVRNVRGTNLVHLPDDDAVRLAGIARRYGVRVAGIGSPFGKCELSEEAWAAHAPLFERVLRLADLFDARLVRVFAFFARERRRADGTPVTLADVLPEVAERLAGPVTRAAQQGLTLGLENEYTTLAGNCAETRSVLDAVGSPNLKVCWDVASGWYTGEPVLPYGYEQVRHQICDVHVRDAIVDPEKPGHHGAVTRLGDGAIDWPEVVRRLRADGYNGPLSLETHLYVGDPERETKLKAATIHGMRVLQGLLEPSSAAR